MLHINPRVVFQEDGNIRARDSTVISRLCTHQNGVRPRHSGGESCDSTHGEECGYATRCKSHFNPTHSTLSWNQQRLTLLRVFRSHREESGGSSSIACPA